MNAHVNFHTNVRTYEQSIDIVSNVDFSSITTNHTREMMMKSPYDTLFERNEPLATKQIAKADAKTLEQLLRTIYGPGIGPVVTFR